MRRTLLVMTAAAVVGGVVWMTTADATDCVAPYRLPILQPGGEDRELAMLEARVKNDPEGGLDLAAVAGHYLKQGRLEDAERAATTSLRNLPFSNVGAKIVLAEVAEARHDFDKAVRLAEEILRERAGHEGALSILVTANLGWGRVDEAGRAAELLASALPRIGPLALRALVAVARGDDPRAEADFRAALRAEDIGEGKASAWTRVLYGRFHLQRGRTSTARGLFKEALRIDPSNWHALWHLGQAEELDGDVEKAELHFAHAWQLSSEPPVLADLARLTQSDEKFAQAAAIVREEIKTTPFGHRAELARILMLRGRDEDRAEALSLAEADAEIRRDAETMATLARARLVSGDVAGARRAMDQALKWGVRHPEYDALAAEIKKCPR